MEEKSLLIKYETHFAPELFSSYNQPLLNPQKASGVTPRTLTWDDRLPKWFSGVVLVPVRTTEDSKILFKEILHWRQQSLLFFVSIKPC